MADKLTLLSSVQPANNFYVMIPFIAPDAPLLTGTVPERFLYKSGNFSIRVTDNDLIAGFGANEKTAAHTFVPGFRYVPAVGKGPTGGLAIYINGELKVEDDSAPFLGPITPGTVFIGSDQNGENQFDGVIESLEIGDWE